MSIHFPCNDFVREVLCENSLGEQHPLQNGDELLFADLRKGLVIACDEELIPNYVNPGTCQVSIEVPFPMGSDAMRLWGREIIGYQVLILDSLLHVEANTIQWFPSQTSLTSVESMLRNRMRDFIWQGVSMLTIPETVCHESIPTGEAREASVRLNRLTTEEDLQYLCTEFGSHSIGTYGVVFNWQSPSNYWAIVCLSRDGKTQIIPLQIEDGIPKTFPSTMLANCVGQSIQIAMKQTIDGMLCNYGDVHVQLPIKFMPKTRIGLVGELRPEYMQAVYPLKVENLLQLPSHMLGGHYQDRRTLARLVVKCGLLRFSAVGNNVSNSASQDFENYFYLVASKSPRSSVLSDDPYASTDGHPSIGGHLLFLY
jgi:hypothetical protein